MLEMTIVPVQNAEQNTCVNKVCPFCGKHCVTKAGHRKRRGHVLQQYRCQACNRWFIRDRLEPYCARKNVWHSQETIAEVVRLYREHYGPKIIQRMFQAKEEYLSITCIYEYLKKNSVRVNRNPSLPLQDMPKICPICQGSKIIRAGFRYSQAMKPIEQKFKCKTCGSIFFPNRLPRRSKYPQWLKDYAIQAYSEQYANCNTVPKQIQEKFKINVCSALIRHWLFMANIPRKKPWDTLRHTRIMRDGKNAFKCSEVKKQKISRSLKAYFKAQKSAKGVGRGLERDYSS